MFCIATLHFNFFLQIKIIAKLKTDLNSLKNDYDTTQEYCLLILSDVA